MDKTTHAVRIEYWRQVINECNNRPGSQTARQWLSEHGITKDQYYYWQRKVRLDEYQKLISQQESTDNTAMITGKSETDPSQEITFTEVPYRPGPDISEAYCAGAIIKTEKATISLSNSISKELLSMIIREVCNA